MPEMDDSGRHEVSHMASFLSRAVASELCEHAQVQANPEWKALADSAAESLWRSIRRPAGHLLETMEPYPGNKPAILGLVPLVIDMRPRLLSSISGSIREMLKYGSASCRERGC